ncbi:hypothetical protein GB931_04060 [Modestobacter sp. I12A-02628]|uniref:Uncharacterized protein n=1 Tax=Goekera deserti TaxID=2497753 RepID=A0A7K3WIJ5_9ACTN|nr:hypothetical protein [Goekera deserti]MPQ97113.1 hypothetical protein [Goekera deserti]NDI46569.1 hypothetical protein [Goekera deserti]NEL56325.1 hypothetical protein [Goekera deserti]
MERGAEPGGARFWVPAAASFALLSGICAATAGGAIDLPVGLGLLVVLTAATGALGARRSRTSERSHPAVADEVRR